MKKNIEVEQVKTTSIGSGGRLEHLPLGAPARVLESGDLFGKEHEIGIMHQGALYRLRVTRGGKLILNK